jgi:hypothetical protein
VSIPPLILNGVPTCPQGYGLSPDQTECIPITAPITVNSDAIAAQEIDPSQAARQAAGGWKKSGIIADLWTMFWTWFARHIADLVSVAAGVFDKFLAALAEFFFAAQGQRNEAYFELVAALMTDLTGIAVDGKKMFAEFSAKGRVASMRVLGGSFFNAIASESAGIEQVDAGSAWKVSPGAGVGGLPVHDFAPGDGVKAAQAMLGFATSFAVREGNTDMLADYLPYGVGRWFKDFAEDFSKSVGLQRLLRVALRPMFQIMIAIWLQYDLHRQYRPTLLGVTDAIRAWKIGAFSDTDLAAEMQMHGFSDARIKAMTADKSKALSIHEYRTLLASGQKITTAGVIHDDDIIKALAVDQYSADTVKQWLFALDLDPARRLSLTYVEHYVFQYLTGHITTPAIRDFLAQAQHAAGVLITPGEYAALTNLVETVSVNPVLRTRHLPFTTLQTAYIDGTITLDELESHLELLGYTAEDRTVLTLETLFKAKEKAAVAAAKAAKKKTGTSTPGSTLPGIGTTGG